MLGNAKPEEPVNPVAHVVDILSTAGRAFAQLSALAGTLQSHAESRASPQHDAASSARALVGTKWGDEDLDLLREAVRTFASSLDAVAHRVRAKGLILVCLMVCCSHSFVACSCIEHYTTLNYTFLSFLASII